MSPPTIFLSYSHDSPDHKEWVERLAGDLRRKGIEAVLDQWDLAPGSDIAAFMEESIAQADRVLLVCTDRNVSKAEDGIGGVGFERLIVTGELVSRIDTKKFIPIVRQSSRDRPIPGFLGPRRYLDFSDNEAYEQRVDELAREIHGIPPKEKPPLGPNPYTSIIPASPATVRVGASGLTVRGDSVLDDIWFGTHFATAMSGLTSSGKSGMMEVRAALHDPLRKSQLELLNAVRQSEIRTFGWPIGILLENRPEFRPKPTAEGIVAEVAINEKSLSGHPSYDYWALRNNADFMIVQNLFEDERIPNRLFFDTRIVRVTESFLFLSNLFSHLGATSDAQATVRVGHRGLAGRTITAASPNRQHMLPATTVEDRAETEISDSVAGLRINIVNHVMQVVEPLFMLFDFTRFEKSVVDDIVRTFASGHLS